MAKFDYGLMYVTDDRITEDNLFFSILKSALKGGANSIQLREKKRDTLSFYNRAVMAKKLCDMFEIPLIINDRLDIAIAVNAHGLHIGQKDIPYTIARKLLGKDKIIGLSVSNEKQAAEANELEVDYIGLSPIFATSTKTLDLEIPLGIEGLKMIKNLSNKPIICIGGININNAKDLITNGSDGIAVVSSISEATNPELQTNKLKEIICKSGIHKQEKIPSTFSKL
jgi:thiamine-phosphate pyrophosphorylase